MSLTNQELMQVTGGGAGIWAIVGGTIAFLISVFEGFINPSKCKI